jgi:hypothetical protein
MQRKGKRDESGEYTPVAKGGAAVVSEEVRTALKNLRKAFFDLLSATSEEEWQELEDGYPFERSFDDLTIELANWVDRHAG